VIRAELYPLYGGYWGYLQAPYRDVLEQTLVLLARKKVEAKQGEDSIAEIEDIKEDMQRNRR
jgi:hypothetical protein